MLVMTESGRRLTIPRTHTVFEPIGDFRPGQEIDPETVDVSPENATHLAPGKNIIIDNRVERIASVVLHSIAT
jgi:hypothetical protein